MIFLEFDLAGAEWVVTAYLSGDANMIEVINSGKSPHIVTGARISSVEEKVVEAENKIVGNNTDPDVILGLREAHFPELLEMHKADTIFLPRSMSIRQMGKKSNHGLNYGMKHRKFALLNEVTETDAMPIVHAYSTVAYPGLQDYWKAIREELRTNNRVMYNCFGRKVRLLGEWGHDLFMAAYSFKPQSTVVDTVNDAMCMVYEDEGPLFVQPQLGAQVHDSLMLQHPMYHSDKELIAMTEFCLRVKEYITPEIEYNGHKFQIKCDLKVGVSWGHMETIRLVDDVTSLSELIRAAVAVASAAAQKSQQRATQLAFEGEAEAGL